MFWATSFEPRATSAAVTHSSGESNREQEFLVDFDRVLYESRDDSNDLCLAVSGCLGIVGCEPGQHRNHVSCFAESFLRQALTLLFCNLIPVLTALENVMLPSKLTGLTPKQQLQHATTALELVGLGDRLHHIPRQLSGGQEQRVAIARAIVTDPDFILADEPTGNLDSTSGNDVLTLLAALNREHEKTILLVTDDPHAARYAKGIRYLEKGVLLPEGRVPQDWAASIPVS